MGKRISAPELITFLIFLEVVSFLLIDGLFASGLIANFQTEIQPIEFIYLRSENCAGCKLEQLDLLANRLSSLKAVNVMRFKSSEDDVLLRSYTPNSPSISTPYSSYLKRPDIQKIVSEFLLSHEKELVGGVLHNTYAMVLAVPFALPTEECRGEKPTIEYFSSNDTNSEANQEAIAILKERFGEKISINLFLPEQAPPSYEIYAVPSYVFNCKYKKIGSFAVSKGARTEADEVSRIICNLLEEEGLPEKGDLPEICS